MPSKDRTTSVKLDDTTRRMLAQIAAAKNRSVHSLMKEAIKRWAEREAAQGFAAYLATGKPVPPRMTGYLYRTEPGAQAGLPPHIAQQLADGNNRLRVLRGWRGMSAEKLIGALAAMGVRLDAQTLDAFEDDRLRPSGSMTGALAKALNVSVEALMG